MVLSTNECGCTIEEIVFTYDNGESGIKPQINYCPLHKSASDMYEALNSWSELYNMRPLDSGPDIDTILRRCWAKTTKALAKAEGKDERKD